MFQQLAALLSGNTQLTLMITGTPAKMSVIVMPKSKSSEAALNTPLQLVGSAAELDEKFAELITQYGSSIKSLEEQLANTQSVIDAAKKESSNKAVKAITGNSESATSGGINNQDGEDDDEDADEAGTPPAPPAPAASGLTAANLFAGM